jgi:hypothetical protein
MALEALKKRREAGTASDRNDAQIERGLAFGRCLVAL